MASIRRGTRFDTRFARCHTPAAIPYNARARGFHTNPSDWIKNRQTPVCRFFCGTSDLGRRLCSDQNASSILEGKALLLRYFRRAEIHKSGSDTAKQKTDHKGRFLFWLRNQDLNPDEQSQSLLCYRYTIPQLLSARIILTHFFLFVKSFFKKSESFLKIRPILAQRLPISMGFVTFFCDTALSVILCPKCVKITIGQNVPKSPKRICFSPQNVLDFGRPCVLY